MTFVTTISKNIKYRTATYTASRHAPQYREVFDKVFCLYNAAGFTIIELHCDQEFIASMNHLQDDLDIIMNFTAAQA